MGKHILVVDYKSKYSKDIKRHLQMHKVDFTFVNHEDVLKTVNSSTKGIILSGGKNHVYEKNAPLIDKKVFDLGIPIFGICYGLQVAITVFGGKISPLAKRHKGLEKVKFLEKNPLFKGYKDSELMMFNHLDHALEIPKGFHVIGITDYCPAVIIHKEKPIYLIQFHPEAKESLNGDKIIHNFIKICEK